MGVGLRRIGQRARRVEPSLLGAGAYILRLTAFFAAPLGRQEASYSAGLSRR